MDFTKLIKNNMYVKNYKKTITKDESSFSYLIDLDISQSDSIKLGLALESITRDIITKYTKLIDIKQKNLKDVRERDHVFFDGKNTVYYAEIKTNLNLDTEKRKSTTQKCIDIHSSLCLEFPNHEVKQFLVGLRYTDQEEIPTKISKKYDIEISSINKYFKELKVPVSFDRISYKKFINSVVIAMMNK